MRVWDEDGVELDAEFTVEVKRLCLSLVLESAGGTALGSERARNSDYVPALRLLLSRLRQRRAVLLSAVVASSRLSALPESERTLLPGPVDLPDVADIEQLRLGLTRPQGKIGLPEGAVKEGNNRKRIRFRLAVPGDDPADAGRLAADLALGRQSDTSTAQFGREDLVAALGDLVLHHHDGLVSVHKPLALLWTIGRVAGGGPRLVPWPEFRDNVGKLLAEFGPSYSNPTPQYPFWHLRSSAGLWESTACAVCRLRVTLAP